MGEDPARKTQENLEFFLFPKVIPAPVRQGCGRVVVGEEGGWGEGHGRPGERGAEAACKGAETG